MKKTIYFILILLISSTSLFSQDKKTLCNYFFDAYFDLHPTAYFHSDSCSKIFVYETDTVYQGCGFKRLHLSEGYCQFVDYLNDSVLNNAFVNRLFFYGIMSCNREYNNGKLPFIAYVDTINNDIQIQHKFGYDSVNQEFFEGLTDIEYINQEDLKDYCTSVTYLLFNIYKNHFFYFSDSTIINGKSYEMIKPIKNTGLYRDYKIELSEIENSFRIKLKFDFLSEKNKWIDNYYVLDFDLNGGKIGKINLVKSKYKF